MSVQEDKKNGPGNLSSALTQAQDIVEAAEKRATALMDQAEKSYHDAREKGFHEGYQQGLEDATSQAVRLIEQTGALQEKLSQEAAKLAVAIAGSVISEEISVTPEYVQKIALKALQESVVGDAVTFVVHPEDEKTLKSATGQFKRVAEGAAMSVETDDSLTRGGCIVRTEFGEVDASIETLLTTIAQRLGLDEDAK